MGTTADSAELIIILSDDDDEDQDIKQGEDDLSCLIVEQEDVKKTECVSSQTGTDEDLVVTFCQRAEVLPHARYDCTLHPFTPAEQEMTAPVGNNHLFCEQCFCYVCDKPASSCTSWNFSGACHCNSHKKSTFWTNLRNGVLLGRLTSFNLTLSETDSHLRNAETMLQGYSKELSVLYVSFLKGQILHDPRLNLQHVIHDYTCVFKFVSAFLDKADQQDSRAAAIMNLGAAEDFLKHYYCNGMVFLEAFVANPTEAKILLLQRVIATVTRLMVMADFTSNFIFKLQEFFKRLFLPTEMKHLKNSLCVRPWDDVLLVTVLKGQNTTGVRKDKGKKDVLMEKISVVLLRTELLQRQHRYRDLCRYLRVVKTDNAKHFQQVQDLIPFFTCMEGDLAWAGNSLFLYASAPALRLTPDLFLVYLRIFTTATAPKLTVSQTQQLHSAAAAWESITGAVPLKRVDLVKFALLSQMFCQAVYMDSRCWTSLLKIVNTCSSSLGALPPPSRQFLHDAKQVVESILADRASNSIHIPRDFLEVCPDQALLLLVTRALAQRIVCGPLCPLLPALNTFKENMWAYRWLHDCLSSEAVRFKAFAQEITREMESAKDGDPSLFLGSAGSALPPSEDQGS